MHCGMIDRFQPELLLFLPDQQQLPSELPVELFLLQLKQVLQNPEQLPCFML